MTINCRGQLLDLSSPRVMGILNITPDSFYDGGAFTTEDHALKQAEKLLHQGASILDIGGMSSRPGATIIPPEVELKRVIPILQRIIRTFPEAIISVDTIHSRVAAECLQMGAHIINDISAGNFDPDMIPQVALQKAVFIVMHMQGVPDIMQKNPHYENVVPEITDFFTGRITACRNAGITDIILDVGFGFGKTLEHNFTLLNNLNYFVQINLPVLAGLSRKSMICKALGVNPENALNGTTALNTIALLKGAHIIRVHDVKEAMEVVSLLKYMKDVPQA